MRRSSWIAALVATVLMTATITAALAAGGQAASARGIAKAGAGRDLVIVPPAALDLSAPPFSTPVVTVTYGEKVTLDEVRDDVPPTELTQPNPGKVPPPSGGRYVAFKVTVVNTGSQGDTAAFVQPVTSDGEVYGDTDLTLRGCAYYFASPPWQVAPGARLTGCIVYEVNTGVTVTGARANIGFTVPSARGAWRVVDREPERRSYVALGDSYSSGEGSGDYDTTDPGCHRGARAWPRLLARALPALLRIPSAGLIACSGATSGYLLDQELGQLDRVRPRPAVITVTIGGNDVGFAGTLRDCVLPWEDCWKALFKTDRAIGREAGTLEHDYETIRHFEPQAAVVVVGYPRLFPSSERDVVQTRCGWLTDEKRDALNYLDASLDGVISKAAAKEHVAYVNITGALNGHEACTAHSWLYPVPAVDPYKNWAQQDGHPTAPGQAAIAGQVERYLTSRFYT